MMTVNEMQERLSQLTYLPGYEMKVYQGRFEGAHFQLTATVEDYTNKGKTVTLEIHSPISYCANTEAFDNWLVDRLIRIASHEVREALQFNGKPIFDPHKDDKDL